MFPELLTPRLQFRRLVSSDAERMHAYRVHPEVLRFQNWEPPSVQAIAALIEELQPKQPLTPGEWFQLGIARRETGDLIGDFGLHARVEDPRQVEIGITIAPAFQRRGIGREAFAALLEFLFTRTETHRVYCSVDPQNYSCLRLLEQVGMRKEAHLIESLWFKGAWVDDVICAMLRREWQEARQSDPSRAIRASAATRGACPDDEH